MSDEAVVEVAAEGKPVSETVAAPAASAAASKVDDTATVDLKAQRERADKETSRRYRKIYDDLEAGREPGTDERKETPADTETTKRAELAEASKPTESAQESAAVAAELVDDYEGLDAKAINTLRSVKMLPEKEVWGKLPARGSPVHAG